MQLNTRQQLINQISLEHFLQEKENNRVFVKLDSSYTDYFPEYSNYFGRYLILLKSMYGMTNSGKLFAYEFIEWLLKSGFIQSQCQMSIYYKYKPYGSNLVVLSYVDGFVNWYTSEALRKWFVDTLGKILHVNFLGYTHWSTSIRIYQMKDHSISVYQAIYATSIVETFLDIATVKASTKFYKTTLQSDMILTKDDTSTSDKQVEKLTREFNIHYRA